MVFLLASAKRIVLLFYLLCSRPICILHKHQGKLNMKKYMNKTVKYLLCLVLTTSLAVIQYSLADEKDITKTSNELSKLALETAVADVKQRLAQIKPNMRLSYVKQKDDNDGTIKIYKFTPAGISDGKWTAVHTEFTDNNTETKTWDNDALLSLDAFDLVNAKLKSETVNSWLFELPSFVELNFDEEESDQPLDKGEISKVIQAELEVTKKNPHFISYRLYSLKSFAPMFSVKISKLNIYNVLNEAWTNGPLITTSQTEEVDGSLGFFVSIDENITALNSDFKLVEIN
jgi:hypothetical protein